MLGREIIWAVVIWFLALVLAGSSYGESHDPLDDGLRRFQLPPASSCKPQGRYPYVTQIATLGSYRQCSFDDLTRMELVLTSFVQQKRDQLRSQMTAGGFFGSMPLAPLAQFAATQSALAQVRLERRTKMGDTYAPAGNGAACLFPAQLGDPVLVLLYGQYENCSADQLRSMADRLVALMDQIRPGIAPFALASFDSFTQTAPAARFAAAKSSLALLLLEFRARSAGSYENWRQQYGTLNQALSYNTRSVGALAMQPTFVSFTTAQLRTSGITLASAASQLAADFAQNRARDVDRFQQPTPTSRMALVKSSQAMVALEWKSR